MKKDHLKIKTKQTIHYFNPTGYELHEEKVDATLIQLKTYTLLRYTNSKEQQISLKWYPNQNEIELKQPNGSFIFRPREITQTTYATPAGVWLLDVETQVVKWQNDDKRVHLTVNYTLSLHGEKLGKYEFTLQYEQ
ncbi:DUF1934 domain-containing protein [Dolosicoccus paucivorans]|uniref:DUF1934 domain-containing protein n=1 Tax=Dolosicoccus paucivorans TaxID=84521 RepID=A0A2N6SN62_9LACT|nr:DUF1934 domain-containing protein [Dolosicoccus paucivorans]PMB84247.1 hypothetical protein CJ206_04900 [Dolosicoccus paucivorans]PMC58507.1 hypothetical protein CJ205_03990 [Dolosicoccus paucivorans]